MMGRVAVEFSPVQTRRTFEEAVQQIAEKVKLGELQAGDRLPSERALADQMQISRPTLREAVKVLQDSGLVEVRRGSGGGMFVATELVPPELLAKRRDLRITEVAQVLEARRVLEPRVAQLAAMRAGDEDYRAMERTIADQRALIEGGDLLRDGREDRFLALDVRFHLAIARASGNGMLVGLVRQLYREIEIARDMAMHHETVPEWVIDVHERTLGAIRSGDLDAVDRVMDEHLGELERTWEQETGRALVRPVPDFLLRKT
jgi:GntR family transcriptional regulator, transcriptional repressor for pyruvate dehydrogenase complex